MSYYPTLAEDIARAKQILEKGRADRDIQMLTNLSPEALRILEQSGGGTIYGADICAAYKLLESFVEALEAIDVKVAELAVRAQQKARR
jgi:hypothetical protein